MVTKLQQGILPFKVEGTYEPLIARAGLVLPYEMARSVKLPQVIDRSYLRRAAVMPISPTFSQFV